MSSRTLRTRKEAELTFGFGEVAHHDELKGGKRLPSGLMITSMSKNPCGFFSCFGSCDPQHNRRGFL